MRTKSSISEIDAQIDKLREKRRALLTKANERFARAAVKAGLAELEIPDSELDALFEEIAARFREASKGAPGASA
jgi:phage shock protein A